MDITAIVVSYNSEDRIGESVRAHEAALADFESEVIVVDNASRDRSVHEARASITRGRVIANDENLGYGKAANQGIRAASGRACLILNDDARLESGAVTILNTELFSSEEISLVGPRIVDEEGAPMPSARIAFPGPAEEWQRLGDVMRGVNRNSLYPAPSEDPMEVAWLVAACVLGKTRILRLAGGFNPAFFLYSEDIDLCRRLHEMGYRMLTVPRALCVHTGGVSTGEEFGKSMSSQRRTHARDLYYRIWHPRSVRSLIHLRRALGTTGQPARLQHHLPKVVWDGASLRELRKLEPLSPDTTRPST